MVKPDQEREGLSKSNAEIAAKAAAMRDAAMDELKDWVDDPSVTLADLEAVSMNMAALFVRVNLAIYEPAHHGVYLASFCAHVLEHAPKDTEYLSTLVNTLREQKNGPTDKSHDK